VCWEVMLPNSFPQQKQIFHWNKNGHFSWILLCNFTQARVLFNTIIWAVHITFRQLLSQVRHNRSMRLVDWTTSTPLSWSHRLKRGDVLQFLKRWKSDGTYGGRAMTVKPRPWVITVVRETLRIAVLKEKLHVRVTSSNTYLQFV
jgi:hypothetical protein